ncbi:MAG: outer membrane beta-barrel protein [Cyanobacteriota bacterium]
MKYKLLLKNTLICFVMFLLVSSSALASNLEEENKELKEKLDTTIKLLTELQEKYETMQLQVNKLYGIITKEEPQKEEVHIDSTVESLTKHNHGKNPNIMLAGVFTGSIIDNPEDNPHDQRNRMRLQEAELTMEANIDEYSRAFFNFAVNRDEASLEEGYLELDRIPNAKGLSAKFGRFRTDFGKINRVHLHDLPQVDYPDVITNFFGDHGYTDEGIGVKYELPLPFYTRLEVNVLNGENDNMFNMTALEPSGVTRLSSILHATKNTEVEIGVSGAMGVNNSRGDHFSFVQGIDLTYYWRPHNKFNRALTWQTEAIMAQREQANGSYHNNFGMYSYLEYQFADKWSSGLRVDYSDVLDTFDHEWAVSPYIKFAQSDMSTWKLQYKHTQRNQLRDSNAIFLQWVGIIGAETENHEEHKKKIY